MRRLPAAAAFGVATVAAWLGLGSYGLLEPSDARYAEIAREMWASGDYLFPRLLGIHHFHKPPLAYWAATLGYRVFGPNEWGARAALGVSSLLLALILWDFGRRHLERGAAAWTVVCAATTPALLAAGHSLTTDLVLTLLLTAALCAWYDVWSGRGGRGRLAVFYSASGLAFLAKGPVAWLLLALVLGPFAWAKRHRAPQKRCSWGREWGVALGLALAVPWYVFVIAKTPGLLSYFLGGQLASRLRESGLGHPHPWYYFLGIFPALGLPWLALAPRGWRALPRPAADLRTYLGLWAAVPPLFFSLPATKLPLYPMLAYPAVALLAGAALASAEGPGTAVTAVAGALLALLGAGLSGVGTGLVPLPARLSALLSRPLAPVAWVAGGGLLLAGLTAVALSRRRPRAAVLVVAATLAVLPGGAALHADDFPLPTARRVGMAIAREWRPSDTLIEYHSLSGGLPFYAGVLPLLVGVERETQFDAGAQGGRTISNEAFWTLWTGPGRVLAVAKTRHATDLTGAHELARDGGFVLLSNR